MSLPTFKDFLIEASKGKKAPKDKKLFNHSGLTKDIKKVIKLMDKTYDDSLTLLEMIVLTKEVLIDRLEPYREDPKYKERKAKDDEATSKAIFDEIEDALSTHFPQHRGQILRQFLTLIVQPIMDEIQRVGIANATQYFDHKRFDGTAKDSFGKFISQLEDSVIIPNAEDKEVAMKVLSAWAKDARHKAKEAKLTPKQRRLRRIAAAVEKVQDTDEKDDKKEEKKDDKKENINEISNWELGKYKDAAEMDLDYQKKKKERIWSKKSDDDSEKFERTKRKIANRKSGIQNADMLTARNKAKARRAALREPGEYHEEDRDL